MPKRPREHALETESQVALRTALPADWIPRQETPDYALDFSVELVVQDSMVSGSRFYVQLRATDSPPTVDALRLAIKVEAARYYSSLMAPLLMVRYCAPTNQLFARWWHDHDFATVRDDQQTTSFHFDASHEWTPATPALLVEEVRAWRRIRSAALPRPLRLTLALQPHDVHGWNARRIVDALAALPGNLTRRVVLTEVRHEAALGSITIQAAKTIVDLGAGHRCTLYTDSFTSDYPMSAIAADLLLAVAFALGRAGHWHESSELTFYAAPHSQLIHSPEFSLPLAQGFRYANRPSDAIVLATLFETRDDDMVVSDAFLSAALLHFDDLTDTERVSLVDLLRARLQRARALGNVARTATACYNLGRTLGFEGRDLRSAVRYVHEAMHLDASYRARHYVWQELGTMAFNAGRYVWAARAYTAAIQFDPAPDTHARLADALVHSGEYARGESVYSDYEALSPDPAAHWVLKRLLLPTIAAHAGVARQSRYSAAAAGAMAAHADTSPQNMESSCRRALRSDALDVTAWFNLGLVALAAERLDEGFTCFLLAALYRPDDAEAWVNALALGFSPASGSQRAKDLFPLVLHAGYCILGETLFQELVARIRKSSPAGSAESVIEGLRQVLEVVSRPALPRHIRVSGPDGNVREISMPD